VVRDTLVVARARGVDLGTARTPIEHRLRELGPERPQVVRRLEQFRELVAEVANGGREGEIGIIGGDGDADLRVRRGDQALGGGDIGTALEQRRGHSRRYHGYLADRSLDVCYRESRRRLADQHGNRVLEL